MAVVTTVGQRFTQLISHLELSKNAFAMSLDKTATVIQHLVDERNKPGFDLLCRVFEVYPNVSKDWLLEGRGPMLTDAPAPDVPASEEPAPAPTPAAPKPAPAPATPEPVAPEPVAVAPPVAAPAASVPAAPFEAPVAPAPVPPVAAPAASAPVADTSWQTALYTQQMAHQLAMAEMRNQHLLDQQRLMQQMLDLMQRQLA